MSVQHETDPPTGPTAGGALDTGLPAYLVVDEHHRIERARGRLRPRDEAPRLAGWLTAPSTLGDLLGCINAVVEQLPCGQTSRCRFCALQQMVSRDVVHEMGGETLGASSPAGPRPAVKQALLERTCVVNGRPVTRRLHVRVRRMRGTGAPVSGPRLLVALREAPDPGD